jgi:hypothetical protein
MSDVRRWRLLLVVFVTAIGMIATWFVLILIQHFTYAPWIILNRRWWNNLLGIGLILNLIVFFFNIQTRLTSKKRENEGGV